MKLRKLTAIAGMTVALAGLNVAGSPAVAEEDCTTRVAKLAGLARTDSLVEQACAKLAVVAPGQAASVAGVAPAIEFSAPYGISGNCLFTGVITGTNSAQYVLVGEATAIGPAASTSLTCSLSPAGLSAARALPGPAVAAGPTTRSGALAGQTVCTTVSAVFIDTTTRSASACM